MQKPSWSRPQSVRSPRVAVPRLLMAAMSALAARGVDGVVSSATSSSTATCSGRPRIGIVGAGISGLLCAERLRELLPDSELTIFEWGRGPGGRTARRRVRLDGSESQLSFDHAAPFFNAVTPRFRAKLSLWVIESVIESGDRAG